MSDEILVKSDHLNKHWMRHVMGSIGYLAGGLIGFSLSFVASNFLSFKALSASFLNVAIQRPYFDGLSGDNRHPAGKGLGFLGYAAACLITLPVAMTVFVLRKLPIIIGVVFGLCTSVLTFFIKGIYLLARGSVFKGVEESQAIIELKKLFSALNGLTGGFKSDGLINQNGSGGKGFGSFARQCLTFGFIKTMEEKILNTALEALKRNPDASRDEVSRCIDEIVEEYNPIVDQGVIASIFSSEHERQNNYESAKNIAKFVLNHVFHDHKGPDNQQRVPHDLYKNGPSLQATFFGKKARVDPKSEEEKEEGRDFVV